MKPFFLAQSLPAAPAIPPLAPAVPSGVSAFSIAAPFHHWIIIATWSAGITLLILLLGAVAIRAFRRHLESYRLRGAAIVMIIASALYFAILAARPALTIGDLDLLDPVIHKLYVAILLLVALRFLDRLLILPVLARLSHAAAPSRFVHQIIIVVIGVFVLAGYCSWAFSLEISSFLAGSAVISIVLGLALQETLGNFFSGMVLQASVPFKAGDWIQIGDTEGRVVEITGGAVTLITGSNNYILLPNSTVSREKITNYHSPSAATAFSISVGLEYSLPPNDAKRVLLLAASEAAGVLPDPPPGIMLASFDDSAITYKVVFWVDDPRRHGLVEEAVRTGIWYRLNQAGYNIPFPVRTLERSGSEKKQAADREAAAAFRLAAIEKCPLFAALTPELRQQLAGETRDVFLPPGQSFYREHDPGNSLFILVSGTVNTAIRARPLSASPAPPAPPGPSPAAPTGSPRSAPSLQPHEIDAGDTSAPAVFGEVSALTDQPREATIRAKTDAHAIEVDHSHLQNLINRNPGLMTPFSQAATDQQKRHDELLQKIGAPHAAGPRQSHADSVLDRMKRIFSRRIL